MRRLDWVLERPPRSGAPRELQYYRAIIAGLVKASASRLLSRQEVSEIVRAEEQIEALTVSTCEATRAPRIREDADWRQRTEREYDEHERDQDLETWQAERGDAYDCERCPWASPYSLYPSMPCEFNAGPLLILAADVPSLADLLVRPMDAPAMEVLAEMITTHTPALSAHAIEGLDVVDYLDHAVRFLKHWASLGFGMTPDVDADASIITPEGVLDVPIRQTDPSSLH